MFDITNHIEIPHIIWSGQIQSSQNRKRTNHKLTLNGQTLAEVEAYKYPGETINNKRNLTPRIKKLKKKIQAATPSIITETGNKEFKTIQMEAVWQIVDSIIIPIFTYGAERWESTKTELQQLQTIMNKALKTLLFLPQQTPIRILLLQETGYLSIERVIKKEEKSDAGPKNTPQKGPSLNKSMPTNENSPWKARTREITNQELIKEANTKTKNKHWMKKKLQKIGRHECIPKLSRKQCNAVMKVRSSMIPWKRNQKTQYKDNAECRFCKLHQETKSIQ